MVLMAKINRLRNAYTRLRSEIAVMSPKNACQIALYTTSTPAVIARKIKKNTIRCCPIMGTVP